METASSGNCFALEPAHLFSLVTTSGVISWPKRMSLPVTKIEADSQKDRIDCGARRKSTQKVLYGLAL